jgi:imidazoleglycerol-phosphate dehydratase
MRSATIERETKETKISLTLGFDGESSTDISTGIGFFDHMLTLMGAHGGMQLAIACRGDLEVDLHHTVEDVGIVLGQALKQALGDKKGIVRYGTAFVPMDESLAMVCLDISGRPFVVYDVEDTGPQVEPFTAQIAEEFLRAFSTHSGLTLHVRLLYGKNTHHILEAVFKALGRSLREAVALTGSDAVPSTKGILD